MPDSSVEAVLRACHILRAFDSDNATLRLRDIVARTSLSKTTAFRLLKTLEQGGMVERAGPLHYRRLLQTGADKRIRIGFAAQTANSTFSQLVSESVHRAAAAHSVEILEVNNRRSAKVALRNAEALIAKRVDVVLEFQTYENVAPVIASRFLEASIPVIAIEIPHPGAVFFGANNYHAGLIGGRALAKWTRENWGGRVDEVILLEERIAGILPSSRVTGMLAGLRESLPGIQSSMIRAYDGEGAFRASLEVVSRHLAKRHVGRTLIAASNDPSGLGALHAFELKNKLDSVAAVTQSSIPEAREEMRRPDSRLVASVAYFPERYGDQLIPLAIALANRQFVPATNFVKHTLLTRANMHRIYPRESAIAPSLSAVAAKLSKAGVA